MKRKVVKHETYINSTLVKAWSPNTVGDYKKLANAIIECFEDPQKAFWIDDLKPPKEIDRIYANICNGLEAIQSILTFSKSEFEKTQKCKQDSMHFGSTIYIDSEYVPYRLDNLFMLNCFTIIQSITNLCKLGLPYLVDDKKEFYKTWPTNPKSAVFTSVGWSIFEAAYWFLDSIGDQLISGLACCYWKTEDPKGLKSETEKEIDKLVISPKPCKTIKAWQDRLVDYFNKRMPAEIWPLHVLDREFGIITNQLEYEYEQSNKNAIKDTLAVTGQASVTEGVNKKKEKAKIENPATENVQTGTPPNGNRRVIEIDLSRFNENKKQSHNFKEEMRTIASQRYIQFSNHKVATAAIRRIRGRLKNSGITLEQDVNLIRLTEDQEIKLKNS